MVVNGLLSDVRKKADIRSTMSDNEINSTSMVLRWEFGLFWPDRNLPGRGARTWTPRGEHQIERGESSAWRIPRSGSLVILGEQIQLHEPRRVTAAALLR